MKDSNKGDSFIDPLPGADQIPDPRDSYLAHYPIPEILFLVVAASVSYCDKFTEMAVFGEEKIAWLQKYYPYKYGTPSHDTLGRVLGMIDRRAFETWFMNWVADTFDLDKNEQIALDGKRLSGSANKADQSKKRDEGGHYSNLIVNAFATGSEIVLGHCDVSSKLSEIKGAKQLLKDLSVEGCCISGDSNFCNRDFLEMIIDKRADYLMALKGKSPFLHQASREVFAEESIPKSTYETEETGHGRAEKRTYRSVSANALDEEITGSYSNLQQVIKVTRERRITRKEEVASIEIHYYITSLTNSVEQIAHKIRGHWGIENRLHWLLDVGFGEDDNRVRKANQASNSSLVRKMGINLLADGPSKAGTKLKRMRAMWSDETRDTIFRNSMR
jgi:predicted transposase YbfD/YdcC